MPKVLLRSNRRIAMLVLVVAALGIFGMLAALFTLSGDVRVLRYICIFVVLTFGVLGLFALRLMIQPRITLSDDGISVFARFFGGPIFVPLDIVEVFFMGQGAVAGEEPGHPKDYQGAVAANVIVRLAESDKSWHARDIHQWFGLWADGYITVRGLLCEDINQELLKMMNHELAAAKRKMREAKTA